MKNIKSIMLGIYILIPLAVSIVSAYMHLPLLGIASFIMIFIVVKYHPFCHQTESLWIFIITAIVSIPFNWMVLMAFPFWKLSVPYVLYGTLQLMMLFMCMIILISIEEIVAGMIGRILWPNQMDIYIPCEKLDVKDDEN